MIRAPRLAALALILGCTLSVWADGIKFGTDFDAGLQQAKSDNKLVILHFTQKTSKDCVKMTKEVFSNPEIGKMAAKKFVAVRLSIEQEKANKLFGKFSVTTVPTVMVVDANGLPLLEENYLNAEQFAAFLETAANLQATVESLAKIKKGNSAALIAALKKITAISSKRSKKVLLEHAENEELPESIRRVALDGVTKQPEPAGELVPFLGEKSQAMRTIAVNALKTIGAPAMPALLEGLGAFSPDQRASCFTLAYPHTKIAKVTKDAAFWKTAKAETREEAIKVWKEWWEKHKDDVKN